MGAKIDSGVRLRVALMGGVAIGIAWARTAPRGRYSLDAAVSTGAALASVDAGHMPGTLCASSTLVSCTPHCALGTMVGLWGGAELKLLRFESSCASRQNSGASAPIVVDGVGPIGGVQSVDAPVGPSAHTKCSIDASITGVNASRSAMHTGVLRECQQPG